MSDPLENAIELELAQFLTAQRIADNLSVELREHDDVGYVLTGYRFVNHVETIDQVAAWLVGYQAAYASQDKLFAAQDGELRIGNYAAKVEVGAMPC